MARDRGLHRLQGIHCFTSPTCMKPMVEQEIKADPWQGFIRLSLSAILVASQIQNKRVYAFIFEKPPVLGRESLFIDVY